jgi:hypothetical protein
MWVKKSILVLRSVKTEDFFLVLNIVIHKVTTEPYRVNRVITNSYFDIKAGDTKYFIHLYSLSHKIK